MSFAYWKITFLLWKLKILSLKLKYRKIKTKILGTWVEKVLDSSEWKTFENKEGDSVRVRRIKSFRYRANFPSIKTPISFGYQLTDETATPFNDKLPFDQFVDNMLDIKKKFREMGERRINMDLIKNPVFPDNRNNI